MIWAGSRVHHEQADLASQATPSAKPRTAGPCGRTGHSSAGVYTARKPLARASVAARNWATMSARIAIGYEPKAGSATRLRPEASAGPDRGPRGQQISPAISAPEGGWWPMSLSRVTATPPAGEPRTPPPGHSRPAGAAAAVRHAENAAAAGRRRVCAPARASPRHPRPSRPQAAAATTSTLTTTPTAARLSAAGAAVRARAQLVVALGQDQHQRAEQPALPPPGRHRTDQRPPPPGRPGPGRAAAPAGRSMSPPRHRREHHRGADEQDQTELARATGHVSAVVGSGPHAWWPPVCRSVITIRRSAPTPREPLTAQQPRLGLRAAPPRRR